MQAQTLMTQSASEMIDLCNVVPDFRLLLVAASLSAVVGNDAAGKAKGVLSLPQFVVPGIYGNRTSAALQTTTTDTLADERTDGERLYCERS